MAKYKTTLKSRKVEKPFPIWLIISGLGLLLVAAFLVFRNGPGDQAEVLVTGAPSIEVDQKTIDYGDVALGVKPILTTVKVTNVGDQDLVFTEAPYIELVEGC